jgi:hypothetical protein
VDDAVKIAAAFARCLGSDLGAALDDERAHAAPRQRGGDRAAGEAGADRRRRRQRRTLRRSRSRPPASARSGVRMLRGGIGAVRNGRARDVALAALPRARSTAKPALARPSRTRAPALHVATVAPGAASRAIALKRRGSHIAGLRAGAKPSRKNASTARDELRQPRRRAPNREQQLDASSSNAMRCRLHVSGGQRGELGGERRERSVAGDRGERARVGGDSSIETKCSRRQRSAIARHAAHVARKLLPRPNPGLEDDEAVAAAPALGERAVGEEDVARLRERAAARVVDVAVRRRSRRAVVVDDDLRRNDRRVFTRARGAGARARARRAGGRARGRGAGTRAPRATCWRSRRAGARAGGRSRRLARAARSRRGS